MSNEDGEYLHATCLHGFLLRAVGLAVELSEQMDEVSGMDHDGRDGDLLRIRGALPAAQPESRQSGDDAGDKLHELHRGDGALAGDADSDDTERVVRVHDSVHEGVEPDKEKGDGSVTALQQKPAHNCQSVMVHLQVAGLAPLHDEQRRVQQFPVLTQVKQKAPVPKPRRPEPAAAVGPGNAVLPHVVRCYAPCSHRGYSGKGAQQQVVHQRHQAERHRFPVRTQRAAQCVQ